MGVLARITMIGGLGLLTACAAPPPKLAANESVQKVPVRVALENGGTATGEVVVTVFTPAGEGRHPLIVINHGRAGDAAGRAKLGRARYAAASRFFTDAGFVVALPVRLGYGVTGGPDLENSGPCGERRFTPMFDRAASQIDQVLRVMAQRPDVDPARVVVLGQSVGGGSTVALAAQNPAGVKTAINFAGGSGGDPVRSPGKPCGPERLQATYAGYGQATRLPMLWIYTENDLYWGPDWPRRWVEAYNQAGGRATFVPMGPDGENGHSLFTHAPQKWQPVVAKYLREQGFDMPQ
ncbi:dienelactone hydrolase family protein [Achromobacter sp. CF-sbj1-Ac2-l]|uniref:Dienelactone hydrolase domain-containing protein n=1 Tax=Achromobacter dolens TaxID=1287738 RepID=A0A6S7EEJ2_9BURK|nr:dienelactone hydrolase family protein [Achromobacter dolens]CAB3908818.1 hypothetical protein LMG26841_04870 [Achromobacter dolens]